VKEVCPMPVYAKPKDIAVPGELLAEGQYAVEGAVFVIDRKVYAKTIGVVEIEKEKGKRKIKVVPLKKKYIPHAGDRVIGKVVDVGVTNWTVDINSPYTAILQASEVLPRPTDAARIDLSSYLSVGDIIVAKVIAFDFSRDPLLTIKERGLGRVTKGTLVEIDPAKVARVIGKKGSMIKLLRDMLGVEIIVGQNGRIIVMSEDRDKESLALLAIKKIEREAHVSGLTDRIKAFLRARLEGSK